MNKRLKILLPIAFIMMLFCIQLYTYKKNAPEFAMEKVNATVAEVYTVWKHVHSPQIKYVYKVDSVYYISGTNSSRKKFKDWKSPDSRKFLLIYNVDDPRLHIIITMEQLSDSIIIGQKLDLNSFKVPEFKMLTTTFQKALIDKKYLVEYQDIKAQLNNN